MFGFPIVALAQSADLALRIQRVPDEPLDAGDRADIVLSLQNLGPDPSGPLRISTSYIAVVSDALNPVIYIAVVSDALNPVIFSLASAPQNTCSLLRTSAEQTPGGALYRGLFFDLPSIPPAQTVSCWLGIEVADPLRRRGTLRLFVPQLVGSAADPNRINNEGSVAVGSDTPRVIPWPLAGAGNCTAAAGLAGLGRWRAA